MQLNETNSEPVPDKIISPIPLQDILLSAHQDISQHLGAFLATGDQPQLNQSVKTCYKAMSLVDVLHDYCPSIVSLGATLVTPSTWKLLSASNLKVRLEIFRRVLCDPLYTKPIDTALFDPEYQVSDAISIASLNYTFPFVQFSSNSASLSQFFNKDYYGKQTEEFMFELAQTCNKQLKQKQKLYIQGNILYIENPGFVLQLFFYQNRDFKDAYTDINTLQFYFLQLNQKKSLNGYNSLELQNYVNLIGKKNISNNCILSIQLWEVELLFLVYYVSNYILKYFATSNADDKFQQIISSWRLFMNYSLTQEGQKYDFDRIRPQSTIQSRYLIFQKGKIEITTCNKRTAMTKINAVEDVQGRSTNSLNKLRQF
ncbi:Conserved_hypothetical protein [Hexamita inflata]|uniref:Uncharacterized protein n=1 Tax=Hexamita inflata TaxID=28002 RepID=A0AA86ULE7_9EUKA|nr:Conserved hypothetical protein [Hexamita inflata]